MAVVKIDQTQTAAARKEFVFLDFRRWNNLLPPNHISSKANQPDWFTKWKVVFTVKLENSLDCLFTR